jgi:hypothetical protein
LFLVRRLTVALGACIALPAPAHHSEAAYDAETVAAFEGTVTRYGWRNPHVYIGVSVAEGSGEPGEWLVETGATPIMVRSGWTPESLLPGDVVTVRAHPDKEPGRLRAILLSMTKADGTVLAQHDGTPEQPQVRTSTLNGVWSGRAETIVSFNQTLNATPLTPAGTAAREQYDFRRDSPAASCVGPPSPGIVTAAFLYLSEIETGTEIVTIRNEFFDVVRTVHMDGRQHPEDGELSNQGHSIGWWEDGTLVVDTRLFAEHPSANGQGVPSSPQKHVVERYALSEDGTGLVIDVFLEDPVYLAEPFEGRLEWQYAPGLRLYQYNCDPEISRIFTQP